MQFLADLMLATAALGAAVCCVILSRRLGALSSLEGGMGNAIAVLSRQVDDLTRSLKAAQDAAARTSGTLTSQTERAESAARRLELLVASMHDLPDAPPVRVPSPWPADAGQRKPLAEPDPEPSQRARILRRRPEQGGAQ